MVPLRRHGYTGLWFGSYINLLYLRARWYLAETGTFLSRDPVENEPPYQYVRGNPTNRIDPSGFQSPSDPPSYCYSPQGPEDTRWRDDSICRNWNSISNPARTPTPTIPPPTPGPAPQPDNACQPCRPYEWNNGYSEFVYRNSVNTIIGPLALEYGKEVVFDFATLQIAEFDMKYERPAQGPQVDIGIISWEILVWGTTYISGFSAPPGNVLQDYTPPVRTFNLGASAGIGAHIQGGGHIWKADSTNLWGYGYWYGVEASLLDLLLGAIEGVPILPEGVGPEFNTYRATTSNGRILLDLKDVCDKDIAQQYLNQLQTWPSPGSLNLGRTWAANNFKRYAGLP